MKPKTQKQIYYKCKKCGDEISVGICWKGWFKADMVLLRCGRWLWGLCPIDWRVSRDLMVMKSVVNRVVNSRYSRTKSSSNQNLNNNLTFDPISYLAPLIGVVPRKIRYIWIWNDPFLKPKIGPSILLNIVLRWSWKKEFLLGMIQRKSLDRWRGRLKRV